MFANHEKASFQYVVNKFRCNDSTPKIFPQLIRHTIVLKFINKFNISIAFLSHISKHFCRIFYLWVEFKIITGKLDRKANYLGS